MPLVPLALLALLWVPLLRVRLVTGQSWELCVPAEWNLTRPLQVPSFLAQPCCRAVANASPSWTASSPRQVSEFFGHPRPVALSWLQTCDGLSCVPAGERTSGVGQEWLPLRCALLGKTQVLRGSHCAPGGKSCL